MRSLFPFAYLALSITLITGRVTFARAEEVSVANSPSTVSPLLIGAEVPDVVLRTVDGTDVSLRKRTADKPTVIIFYRGGW